MKRNHGFRRVCALVLSLPLLLTACSGGGNEATATTMHLQKTQGTVGVSDGGGTSVEPREGLGLYSGYGVGTERSSYAWVDLDEVKLTKLDENSEIEIKKEGKQLEIEVKSGSLFFNVTEPLAADETLDIRSSTMVVGIRGTCGWVTQDAVGLLEGTVEVTAGTQSVTVTAGEMAVLAAEGEIAVEKFTAAVIPGFVREEMEDDEELLEAVGGGETPDGPGEGPDSGADQEPQTSGPLTVLTSQTAYGDQGDMQMYVQYFYDEQGYTLRREITHYSMGEATGTRTDTYSYDNEGHCWLNAPDGSIREQLCEPGNAYPVVGTSSGSGGTYQILMNPMVLPGHDRRSEIGPDGRVEGDGYYGIYTMDENGYPVSIDTYASDGTFTGRATLTWKIIE